MTAHPTIVPDCLGSTAVPGADMRMPDAASANGMKVKRVA
jgi:hypothetical protein